MMAIPSLFEQHTGSKLSAEAPEEFEQHTGNKLSAESA
jgi:hypothetical protein